MKYKIRDTVTGYYSHGIIGTHYDHRINKTAAYVQWSLRGKVFPNEKSVKTHLLKYAMANGIPDSWEVIEVIEIVSKPVTDWFDATMLTKLIKV